MSKSTGPKVEKENAGLQRACAIFATSAFTLAIIGSVGFSIIKNANGAGVDTDEQPAVGSSSANDQPRPQPPAAFR